VPDRPRFAHASEAELARILDYYEVNWQYEPRTFPILWNLEGMVVESFSPDFYLPEMDLYVELTTLRQSLVRRKNRKLRRLRELYPDIRAKLFYGKDFKALMLKYGRFDLAASLSGLEGQTMKDSTIVRPAVTLRTAAGSLKTADTGASVSTGSAIESSADGVGVASSAPAGAAGTAGAAATDGSAAKPARANRKRPSRGTRRRRGRRTYVLGAESR
jgi:hypoxanthine phosphoribosyltransferase